MPKYYHEHNYVKQGRFLRRFWRLILVLVVIGILAGGFIYYDNLTRNETNSADKTTTQSSTSYVASTVRIFRTKYFQFQSDKNWSEASNGNQEGRFVYRSMRGSIVEHELTVYIDREPDVQNKYVTHVLPVRLKSSHSEMITLGMSDHCAKDLAKNKKVNSQIVLLGVTFLCAANDSRYTAFVGLDGGGSLIDMKRPDGSQHKYTLYYANLTAAEDGSQLVDIVNTFQTR